MFLVPTPAVARLFQRLELVRVRAEVRLRDGQRLAEPQLLVLGVVVDDADRAADLVGAEPEVVAGEQISSIPTASSPTW
jgi:hypothetical protein